MNKNSGLPVGQYGDITGYHTVRLTDQMLARYRTGLTAGNPAEMVLLAREIDRLNHIIDLWSQAPNENIE